MNLLVHVHTSVASAQEAHVVEGAVVLDVRHAARDDVDVVADGKLTEPVAYLLGVLCHLSDALCLAHIVELSHQRGIEVFGEEDEVALIVAHRIDEEFHLLEEVVDGGIGAHLPLHETDAHGGLAVYIGVRRWLIVDVVPLQQGGAVFALLVAGQIVAYHTAHVEVVGQLEGEHGVVDLTTAHFLDVLLGAHLVGILVIVGYASAKHDGLEVELLAQLLAVFVHASGQSETTIVGVDEDLDAIEDVAVGIVGVEGFIACHLGIGVVALHHVVVDDDGEGAAHDLVVDDDDYLTFGKDGNELFDLRTCPENVRVGINALERFRQLVVILHVEVAQTYFFDFAC